MPRFITLFALFASTAVLALPAPTTSLPDIGTSLTRAFAAKHELGKRQSVSDALEGLENLLQIAVGGADGGCASSCDPWVKTVTACVNDNVSNNAIGTCACGSTPVRQMLTCGQCVGDDETEDAQDFDALCSSQGVGYGSGSASSVASFGSATAVASATRSGFASAASSAVSRSSAASATATATDSDDSDNNEDAFSAGAGGDPTVTVTRGSADAAETNAPASGAGKVIGGGAVLFAGAVAALMM